MLNELGVPAEFQGRNDIVVDGKKISGNAQAWHKNKMLHHGTILFDADLAFVASVLNVKPDKIQSKGIKSNRARVTNIKPLLAKNYNINDFKENLLKALIGNDSISDMVYPLSQIDLSRIEIIQKEKYSTWEWNYGESPQSNNIKEKRYPGGNLKIHFDLKQGRLTKVKFYGDFLDTGDITAIESKLENCIYDEKEIRKNLKPMNIEEYILKINNDDLLDCLFS